MAYTETLPDGTVRITYSPSPEFIDAYPSYGDWMNLLESRGVAATRTLMPEERRAYTLKYPDRRVPETETKTVDRLPIVVEGGQIKVTCLGCGVAWDRMGMTNIRIGGLVRFPSEEETGPKEVTVKVKLKPISKTGLGCPACADKFMAEQIKVTRENEARAKLALLKSQLADMQSALAYHQEKDQPGFNHKAFIKRFKVTAPAPRVAWIDMFGEGWRGRHETA